MGLRILRSNRAACNIFADLGFSRLQEAKEELLKASTW